MKLSPTHKYPWDAEAVTGENLDEKDRYFKSLIKALNKTYQEIANAINKNECKPSLKSGTTQANAGAVAGELWVDTDDANRVKMGA